MQGIRTHICIRMVHLEERRRQWCTLWRQLLHATQLGLLTTATVLSLSPDGERRVATVLEKQKPSSRTATSAWRKRRSASSEL